MIVLLTDFGLEGPYMGQMHAVLRRIAPDTPVINLFADLPAFDPRASAYLIASYVGEFPAGSVFLCVVDPGVGSARQPIAVKASEDWFVGPDNGLLEVVAKRASGARRYRIAYKPGRLSASFHGRDVFAPVAARLASGLEVPAEPIEETTAYADWPDDLFEIVYIDRYGNAMTGVRAEALERATRLKVKRRVLAYARTFSDAPDGKPFWYENANGLVELAVKQSSAAELLKLRVGDGVSALR